MVYGGIEKQILTKSGKNGNDFVSIWSRSDFAHRFLNEDLFLNPEDFFLNPLDCDALDLLDFFCLLPLEREVSCSAALCFLCISFHVAPISCMISSLDDAPIDSLAPFLDTQSLPSFAKGLLGWATLSSRLIFLSPTSLDAKNKPSRLGLRTLESFGTLLPARLEDLMSK